MFFALPLKHTRSQQHAAFVLNALADIYDQTHETERKEPWV